MMNVSFRQSYFGGKKLLSEREVKRVNTEVETMSVGQIVEFMELEMQHLSEVKEDLKQSEVAGDVEHGENTGAVQVVSKFLLSE